MKFLNYNLKLLRLGYKCFHSCLISGKILYRIQIAPINSKFFPNIILLDMVWFALLVWIIPSFYCTPATSHGYGHLLNLLTYTTCPVTSTQKNQREQYQTNSKNNIRRSQIISHLGPGALKNQPSRSLRRKEMRQSIY